MKAIKLLLWQKTGNKNIHFYGYRKFPGPPPEALFLTRFYAIFYHLNMPKKWKISNSRKIAKTPQNF